MSDVLSKSFQEMALIIRENLMSEDINATIATTSGEVKRIGLKQTVQYTMDMPKGYALATCNSILPEGVTAKEGWSGKQDVAFSRGVCAGYEVAYSEFNEVFVKLNALLTKYLGECISPKIDSESGALECYQSGDINIVRAYLSDLMKNIERDKSIPVFNSANYIGILMRALDVLQ